MPDLSNLFFKSTDFNAPPEVRELAKKQLKDCFLNLFYSRVVAYFLNGLGGSVPQPESSDSVREQLANHEFLI